MPRVVHVISTPTGLGGAEHVMAALVGGGRDRGWDVAVLNPFAETPEQSDIARKSPHVAYEGRRCRHLYQLPGLRRWLHHRIRSFAPDLIHVHLFHALVAVASLRGDRARRVATHHHGDLLRAERRLLDRYLDRWAGKRFDRVVAVSETVRRFLVDEYGYDEGSVACIRNGWSGNPPPYDEPDRPTVISVANLRPEKDHDTLLNAFSAVLERIPDARLVLIGEGELDEALRDRVASEDLNGSVELLGSVEDVWPYLARAHIFALSSKYETVGIAIMEAMAAGLPVVATDVGAVPELVRPGVTGYLAPVGDHESFADKLTQLLQSEAQRRRMGDEGRKAVEPLRIDDMVDRYFSLYEQVLGAR